jgi:ABC-2 type transport system permease protein
MQPDPTALRSDTPTESSPIADLSYRNYDGPLITHKLRWWVITRGMLRQSVKKNGLTFAVVMAIIPYLIFGVMLYLQSRTGQMMPGGDENQQQYVPTFFNAMRAQSFFLFLIALLIGTGAIASDIRANALQVYLAKPITKGDYILGKWTSTFIPIYCIAMLPALGLYLFCLLNFSGKFWHEDPYLILKLLAATAIPAIIHSSLLLGFSAWSKTSFMTGAIYAAFFFVSGVIANIVAIIRYEHDFSSEAAVLIRSLSLNGIIQGLVRNLYHVADRRIEQTFSPMGGPSMTQVEVPLPNVLVLLGVAVALCVLGVLAARMRVRAVEVVKG